MCVIVYNSNNREIKLSIQIMRRERGRNRKREVGNGKRRTLRDLESEGVCVCVCFLKRTQHEDDVVLLKLLLPHVSSFILHKHAHMVNFFFFPHSAWCAFNSSFKVFFFSSSWFKTHNLQVHNGDLFRMGTSLLCLVPDS